MGYSPPPPPMVTVQHHAEPISPASDEAFDGWLALPESDLRTLDEYAANPVRYVTTREFAPKPPPPPAPPASTAPGSILRYDGTALRRNVFGSARFYAATSPGSFALLDSMPVDEATPRETA